VRKGIIFDVDGTLWDSVDVVTESWNECLRRYEPWYKRVLESDEMRGVFGKTMDAIGEALFSDLEGATRRRVLEHCLGYEVEYLKERSGIIYPHVTDTFRALRGAGYHLSIVSNCQKGYIEDFLHHSGAQDLIEDHGCFGETGREKDYTMRLVYERNHLDSALYVGDTQGDLDAADKAGVPFVWARYGFGTVNREVPAIDSMEELPALAGQLLGLPD